MSESELIIGERTLTVNTFYGKCQKWLTLRSRLGLVVARPSFQEGTRHFVMCVLLKL